MEPVATAGDVPAWLHVHSSHVPHVVVADPWKAPVWEITGAEFSASDHHTASRISIRFPRVTKERDDKTAAEATTLGVSSCAHARRGMCVRLFFSEWCVCAEELQALAKNSVDTSSLASAAVSTATDPDAAAFFPTMANGGGGGAAAAGAGGGGGAAAPAPTKPRCKYWDKCYRKNADHLRDFEHPTDVGHTGAQCTWAFAACLA
jgi:hypothetical protein